jgi:hypothetical protein
MFSSSSGSNPCYSRWESSTFVEVEENQCQCINNNTNDVDSAGNNNIKLAWRAGGGTATRQLKRAKISKIIQNAMTTVSSSASLFGSDEDESSDDTNSDHHYHDNSRAELLLLLIVVVPPC